VTETAVRGGGGTLSASIRRRWIGCFDRPPHAAPHRRSEGAPASPLRYSAPRAGGAASPACVSRTRLRNAHGRRRLTRNSHRAPSLPARAAHPRRRVGL